MEFEKPDNTPFVKMEEEEEEVETAVLTDEEITRRNAAQLQAVLYHADLLKIVFASFFGVVFVGPVYLFGIGDIRVFKSCPSGTFVRFNNTCVDVSACPSVPEILLERQTPPADVREMQIITVIGSAIVFLVSAPIFYICVRLRTEKILKEMEVVVVVTTEESTESMA